MDLDTLKLQRGGSKWVKDPKLIKLRQERAYDIARSAETKQYIHGPNYSEGEDDEEEEFEEGEEDAENAEETEPRDGDLKDAEETDSDNEALRLAANTSNTEADAATVHVEDVTASSADEPLQLAAKIGAEVVSEVLNLNPDAAA